MIALSLALACAGFASLCLSMERHYEQVFRSRRIPRRRQLVSRWAGWALIVLSLLPVVLQQGWGFGLVWWAGVLHAAALLLALTLTYAPRLVLAWAAAPLPVLLLLAAGLTP
jgi:predicted anti-sigma-YlaC factor YlaD